MKRKSKILCIFLLVILTISSLAVSANSTNNKEVDDLNKKIDSLNQQLQQAEKNIKQNEQKQKSVYAEIQRLEILIEKTEYEIALLNKDIETTEKKILVTTEELQEAEDNIEVKEDLFASRLNTMYKNGDIGYLEVLLSSKNFSEFLSNFDMVKLIVKHDVDLLKYLQAERDKIDDKKAQLENQRAELIVLKGEAEGKHKDIIASRGTQERLRKELAADKVELEKQAKAFEKQIEESENMIRQLQSDNEYVGGEMQWPVKGHTRISSPYGYRTHPITKRREFHSGIDVPAPTGTDIVAATRGKIVHAGNLGGYGKVIMIDHGGGIITLYAHNSKLVVSVGDEVSKGQKVAAAGSTGFSTGPHLHFEVRKDGKHSDPIPYVKGK
ncbi:murein hydrolase activator EnvC family protein [Alkaliphilus serpentinus]|uniref:Peptidoglycan DD-metalloendopeptidase family protein n=1 Tax=Alkaliphilus serpentinus TaxID=1482731 RepID=A0A833MFF3_9FIRM|nr:peptidoglycan DD-metalloendopeptidase family protein [Alkaliphilus serpentinus]KAB3533543.1 peptidoglycan DD-metalloendopeptidase family protein [Alkaliphilus serpentinus]